MTILRIRVVAEKDDPAVKVVPVAEVGTVAGVEEEEGGRDGTMDAVDALLVVAITLAASK